MSIPKNRKCPPVTLFNALLPKIGEEIVEAESGKIYKAPKWVVSSAILFMQIWFLAPFFLAHFFIDGYIDNFFISIFLGYVILLILDYFLACILFKENNNTDGTKNK